MFHKPLFPHLDICGSISPRLPLWESGTLPGCVWGQCWPTIVPEHRLWSVPPLTAAAVDTFVCFFSSCLMVWKTRFMRWRLSPREPCRVLSHHQVPGGFLGQGMSLFTCLSVHPGSVRGRLQAHFSDGKVEAQRGQATCTGPQLEDSRSPSPVLMREPMNHPGAVPRSMVSEAGNLEASAQARATHMPQACGPGRPQPCC